MPLIDALHGRARVRRAQKGRLVLMGFLFLAMGILVLAALGVIGSYAASPRDASPNDVAVAIYTISKGIICLGPLLAGILIDRFGIKRIVGLAMIAWCAVASVGPATMEPYTFVVVSPLVTTFLPGILLVAVLTSVRLAWAPRRRALAVTVVATAYGYARERPYELYYQLFGVTRADGAATAWPFVMFALVTCGALITAIWLVAFREVSPSRAIDLRPLPPTSLRDDLGRLASLLRQPIVGGLLLIELCHSLVYQFVFNHSWSIVRLREGSVDPLVLVPVVAAPIASLVAAAWSDRILQRTHSLARARRPFIILGFVVLAMIPLAAAASRENAFGLGLLGGAAIGAVRIADIIALDLAPRAIAGRFLGLIASIELFNAYYTTAWLDRLARAGDAISLVLPASALAGAALAFLLLRNIRQAPA